MNRVLVIAGLLQACFCGSALACSEQQKGNVVFEDNFADDSGGWNLWDHGKIEPPTYVLILDKDLGAALTENQTFDFKEGDFCVDVTLPPAPADNNISGGIVFWAAEFNNYYLLQIGTNSGAGLFRKTNGNWNTIYTVPTFPAVKPAGSNSVHVVAKDGLITLSVNGQEFKKLRAQAPAGGTRFGMFTAADKQPLTDPLQVKFQNYKVTTGQ
jgi:hypothetical protein